jgi:hypothetical protein
MRKAIVHWCFEQHKIAFKISVVTFPAQNREDLRATSGLWPTNPFARTGGRPHILNNGDIEYIRASNPALG